MLVYSTRCSEEKKDEPYQIPNINTERLIEKNMELTWGMAWILPT